MPDQWDNVAAVYRALAGRTLLVMALLVATSLAFGDWPAALGVLTGGCVAVLHLRVIALVAHRSLGMSKRQAQLHTFGNYAVRYALVAGILAVAYLNSSLNFWGVIAGLFSLRIAIWMTAAGSWLSRRRGNLTDEGGQAPDGGQDHRPENGL
ncbi:MAG: ATP synthase subunit I [Bacillota bacterium]